MKKYEPLPDSKYADFLYKFEKVQEVDQTHQSYPCQLSWFQYDCVYSALREFSRDTIDKRSIQASFWCLVAKVIDKMRNPSRSDWPISYMPYIHFELVRYPLDCKKVLYEWREGEKRYIAYIR